MLTVSLLAGARRLPAQDSTSWRAGASYAFEAFEDRSPWQSVSIGLTRKTPRRTAVFDVASWRRYDETDVAVVGTFYEVFRRGTYLELRGHWGPDARIVPIFDTGVELYQATGAGFEVSAGYRFNEYVATRVNLANGSVARYAGNWYLRARGTLAFQEGSTGFALGLMARRYFATSDDLAELQGGFGKETVVLAPGSVILTPTSYAAARWQRRFGAQWGGSLGATWNHQDGLSNRAGLTFGLFRVL